MIEKIALHKLLPEVFDGMQHTAPVKDSGVWCRDLSFVRHARYLIFAESGTGKSSLCSFIYGARNDYKGTIEFDGNDIRNLTIGQWATIRQRSIAYLPQEMGLFPELTAIENILIKNRLTDFRSESEIRRMMERLEIDNRADFPAGRLSVGQQQRVAIIRSVSQPFSFIILDEPVSHLDERNNAIVAEMITEAADAQQASIIATSVGNHLKLTDTISLNL